MKKENLSDMQLLSAGAMVNHTSPFERLASYANEEDVSQDFLDQWTIPYYFDLKEVTDEWINKMIVLKPQLTEDIVLRNLGDFNWRTRSTGAYFAAILDAKQFTEIIGVHLLKSEVCFAGHQYATTLAAFNTPEATTYLNTYLHHYLKHPELQFDQSSVITAIKYLDEVNGTNDMDQHAPAWRQFRKAQVNRIKSEIGAYKRQGAMGMVESSEGHLRFWEEDISTEGLKKQIEVIHKIADN